MINVTLPPLRHNLTMSSTATNVICTTLQMKYCSDLVNTCVIKFGSVFLKGRICKMFFCRVGKVDIALFLGGFSPDLEAGYTGLSGNQYTRWRNNLMWIFIGRIVLFLWGSCYFLYFTPKKIIRFSKIRHCWKLKNYFFRDSNCSLIQTLFCNGNK